MGEDKTGASQRAGQPGPRGAENVGLTRPLNTLLLERIDLRTNLCGDLSAPTKVC